MVGGIKARAFKNDTNRRINLSQALFFAFRAITQRLVFEFLITVKTDAAIITLIGIGWHFLLHFHSFLTEPVL